MVGNGVTNWTYDTQPAYVEMAYWHSLYDTATYRAMKNNSCDFTLFNDNMTDVCQGLLDKFNYAVKDINVYNILGTCYGLPETPADANQFYKAGDLGRTMVNGQLKTYKKGFTAAEYTPWIKHRQSKLGDDGLPPCVYGIPVTDWMNSPDVRRVLHIPDSAPGWQMCNDIPYTIETQGSQWVYERLANITETTAKYKILKFSGDIDGSVPTWGTLGWINALNWTVTTEWSQFKLDDGIVGGYFEQYDISGGFTFASVHKAGHMVPQFQPAKAYHLIFNWIKDTLKPAPTSSAAEKPIQN